MQVLEDRIRKDGIVMEGNILKVDSFLNHQIDIPLMNEIGCEFHRLYADEDITKILTIEASGIAIAAIVAQYFGVPILFAKKAQSLNISGDVYTSRATSFTRKLDYDIYVNQRFLTTDDRVLIIDDFLAEGNALAALLDICEQAGAEVAGIGIVIEKAFQGGGERIRSMGVRLDCLARVAAMDSATGQIEFL